jgi:chemotaxis protein MotA
VNLLEWVEKQELGFPERACDLQRFHSTNMIVIVGYVVSMGCIFGVYIVHGGNIGVVLHALPFELVTIFGGALGAFAVNNQPKVLKATIAMIPKALKSSIYTKERYLELMALLYDILQKARKEGLMAIEKDVENPDESPIFKKYATVGNDHHVVEFMTDYLRMMVSGNLNAHEIESLMDSEIDTHHQENHGPVAAIARLAGALPAFGIVAAVLGVINTMGSVGQPPIILGGMIASALVGTFLGILLAYAVVEPLGGLLEQKSEDSSKELQCIKTTLLASMQGYNPATAIEFGRKVLFSTERPTFLELESHVRGKK